MEQQIEQASGIPRKQQRNFFNGRELKSDNVLGDYGIHEGSEVRVLLRLRPDSELRRVYLGNKTAGSAFELQAPGGEADGDDVIAESPGSQNIKYKMY
ncbi:hypothetical protein MY3296_000608 [Beauveria thailandica]